MLRLQKMMQRDARDVLHYVFLLGTRDRDVTVSLDRYFLGLGFTAQQLKTRFNKLQREMLLADNDGFSYDVTLLWTCIMLACFRHDQKQIWVTSHLEHLITAVKNFRNTLMHGGFTGDQTDFVQKTEEIRRTLVSILETAGQMYGVDDNTISQKVRSLNTSLNKVRDDSFDGWDITSYENENLFSHKLKMILTDGVEELRSVYSKWSSVTPVTFLFDDIQLKVDAIYTSVSMAYRSPDGCNQEIGYGDIIQCAQTSNTQTSLTNVAQIILIEGVAGSGKSTLVKLLMSDWVAKQDTMKGLVDIDLVLYKECRNSSLTTLSNYLTYLMPKTASSFRDDDLLRCVLNLRLLLVVDGLDELNENSSSFLEEILQLKRTVDITILCTTRPETVKAFCKRVPEGFQVTSLVIMGIPESKRIEFVLKYHSEMRKAGKTIQNTESLERFLTSSSRLRDHWRLPLNLMLVAVLWAKASASKEDRLSTTTKLYLEFQRITKEKLIHRLRANRKTRHLEELEKKLERFLDTLYWEALQSLRKDDIVLTHESTCRLRDACTLVGLPCEEVFGAFLMQTNMWTSSGPHTRISFFHKGMQDFYAALFIIRRLNNEMINVPSLIQGFQNVMALHNIQDDIRQEITKSVSDILAKRTMLPNAFPSSYNSKMECSDTKCNNGNRSNFPLSDSHMDEISPKTDAVKRSPSAYNDDTVAGDSGKTVWYIDEKPTKENSVNETLPQPSCKTKVIHKPKKGKENLKFSFTSKTLCLMTRMASSSQKATITPTPSEVKRKSTEERTTLTSTPRLGPLGRIFEELRHDRRESLTLNKYQNMLLHLGGLLHDTLGQLSKEMAEELVTLLVLSDLQNSRQWLDLLSEVECDDQITRAVAHHAPTMVNGLVEIDDTTVDVYTALLPLGSPSAVRIKINGDIAEIPRLHDLLSVVASNWTPVMLYLWQDFRHPKCNPSHSDIVHFAFIQ